MSPTTKNACYTLLLLTALTGMNSCTTVKSYQRNKLNDAEMQPGSRKVEKTEMSFQSYREGASGASSGKTGGGCGCN
ncbi:MAG: DUF4266 domain-containing protein [Chitinophagaceae bacterium]|nr:MAG: DUF4266 domain-containing protein [Chitinophagaceae bacterium]